MKYPHVNVTVTCEETKKKRNAKDCMGCDHFDHYFYQAGMQKVACLYPEKREETEQ
ncbi:MAG: hypothetical protein ACETV1_05305 [Candidatus Bathyarchaeia archaeon]